MPKNHETTLASAIVFGLTAIAIKKILTKEEINKYSKLLVKNLRSSLIKKYRSDHPGEDYEEFIISLNEELKEAEDHVRKMLSK